MAVSLSPNTGVLISTQVDVAAQAIISALGFSGGVAWAWMIEGVPPAPLDPGGAFQFTEGGSSLTVDYIVTLSLFPFIVRYLDALGIAHEVDDWALVPPPNLAPEIVQLRPVHPDLSKVTFNLDVTASGTDGGTGQPAQAGGSYTIDILANYSANRDILVSEIDARR